jgi:hypothetical protein
LVSTRKFYFVRFILAVALALITPALFSRPLPPFLTGEKREQDKGRSSRGFSGLKARDY